METKKVTTKKIISALLIGFVVGFSVVYTLKHFVL